MVPAFESDWVSWFCLVEGVFVLYFLNVGGVQAQEAVLATCEKSASRRITAFLVFRSRCS